MIKQSGRGVHREVRVRTGGILHITDDSHMARELTERGEAVLVVLHEANRREDFSFCRYACEDVEYLEERGAANESEEAAYFDKVYRRQKGLPLEILTTKRCLIRETTVADVDAFYRIYAEPCITKYMEPLYEDPEEERVYARDYIDQVYSFYDFGIWTVTDRESGEVIGRAGICYREGFEDPELGFMIAMPWQGKGLAAEVCRAILDYANAELGFDRVLAFVQPENEPSQKICRKLGMKREETVRLQGQTYEKYVWECID